MSPLNFDGETKINEIPSSLTGDEVVITGISGVFPNSPDVLTFMNNLYNKIDMVASENPKWNLNNPDLPKHIGQIKGTDKFDAQFFGVTYHLACALEPMGRKILEHAYGAIFDSGTNLQSIRGKSIGVFMGSAYMDNSMIAMFDMNKRSDFVINGGSKAMLANRVSYWIDGKGPSYGLDYGDVSSTACLERAYHAIKSGDCDAALVGGSNLVLDPTFTLNMRRAGLLCLDGKTKCFDKHADGYCRADAINVIFLQKAKDAHRIYAEVCHAKGKYIMKPGDSFLPKRESDEIESFLNDFYKEANLDPKNVEYVEAQGAAIAAADENELQAINNVFVKDKTLKIGSVKSNMGNSEASSGVCAISKLCLAYHTGKIPANLHYSNPNDKINEKIKVVTENTEFNRGYTAMNSFSFTGGSFHVVLKGHYKQKTLEQYATSIPRIVLASGRQEFCVDKIFDLLKDKPIDPEEIGLLHKIFETDISGHTGRGYALLDLNEKNETVVKSRSVDYYPGLKRPLWFVFSGMGSQWAGMGADLMRIPIFAAAIYKCHKVLESKGLDLIKIVTELDDKIFDNILHAFVGIGAVQIGLTDVIKALGIVPDYIIGHSLGEMACAYHDNTFTAEELILSTYSRGKVCLDTPLIKGSMAAVGVGYQMIVNQCPEEIDIACHNSDESTTISGPADKMKEFVGELTKKGIFAREVPCANIAYHSRYIGHCGPELLRRLSEVIKNPKKRSDKWISTSVPQNKWDEPNAIYSSAEYHTNNLLKPVLFEETSKMIPDNAIVIEIAPHGLLQAILKRSLKDCTHIPLTRRGNKNGVQFLLEAIGKMYQAGLNPKVEVLYPQIQYPVSTETPLLSHFVEWEHSETWPLNSRVKKDEVITAPARDCILSVHDDDYKYLKGHIREGKNVLPEAAILVLVWETVAMYNGVNYHEQSIVFRDVQFHSEVTIKSDHSLKLSITISRGNDRFEVIQGDIIVASGTVASVKILKFGEDEDIYANIEEFVLTAEDIYRILSSRGYSYNDKFESIQYLNEECNKALIRWDDNWTTFLDALFQHTILNTDFEGISIPKFIRKLRISIVEQKVTNIVKVNGVNCYLSKYDKGNETIRCSGVELGEITFETKPIKEQNADVILSRTFYPHYAMEKLKLETILNINLQLIAENNINKEIVINQIVTSNKNINCIIKDLANYIPNVDFKVSAVINGNNNYMSLIENDSEKQKPNVFIVENLLGDEKKLQNFRDLPKDCFILAIESEVPKLQEVLKKDYKVLSCMSDGEQIILLLRRQSVRDAIYIHVNSNNIFDCLPRVYDELSEKKHVILISENCGALGFVQKLRNNGENRISLFVIDDLHAPAFNPCIDFYKEQLDNHLAINVLSKGQWGSFYYSPANTSIKTKNAILTSYAPDKIENLTWIEKQALKDHEVQVAYSGLSLKDVENSLNLGSDNHKYFGMDFSGTNNNGDRVMGLLPEGALASTVAPDLDLLWPVPAHWSLGDAATVPLPYSMAYYCLTIRSHLSQGHNVFITGGSGALGQAVIAVCLSMGCTVFTTVSNLLKKKLLLRLFPCLNENNISCSRNDAFLNMIKTNTSYNGCDIVINCSSGYLREIAMKCIGLRGVFLDLSSYDMYENKDMGMSYIAGDRSYKAVVFSSIFKTESSSDRKHLQSLLAEGINKGTVKPIARIEFSPQEITKAFRFLSASRHIGKVIINMKHSDILKQGFDVTPRLSYHPQKVYIVVLQDNNIGIELIQRLVKRDARKIIIHLSSSASGYLKTLISSWSKKGVAIKLSTEDLETQDGCVHLLKDAMKLGTVEGIFIVQHSDDKKEDSRDTVRKFNKTTKTVINLDLATKNFCKELSYFVVLSTTSQLVSDEIAMSISEKVCQARSEIGLPALLLRVNGLNESTHQLHHSESKHVPISLSAYFNAMENGLKLKYNNILAYGISKQKTENDYASNLIKILGLTHRDNVNKDAIISEMKLIEVTLKELRTFIKDTTQNDYPIDNIEFMTIESLFNLFNQKKVQKRSNNCLSTFFSCIYDEEYLIANSHPIVPMKTLLSNGTQMDLDPTETYLTLIPGLEGRYQIFESAAERLKIQTVGVQLPLDIIGISIPEMARTVRDFMKTKFETKTKFYLLGYSFGVNIALEVAALLEKEGHKGVVICLDSSPETLKSQLKWYLGNRNDDELQNELLTHMCHLISDNNTETDLYENLEKVKTFEDKIEVALKGIKHVTRYSNQYKRLTIQSAFERMLLAMKYQPDIKLNSELVLIKSNLLINDIRDDYGLSKYTTNPVKIYEIEADHATAPYDLQVPNIINKILDPELLKEFNKKNLCETYFVK